MKSIFTLFIALLAFSAFGQQSPDRAVKQYELGMYSQASVSLEKCMRTGEVDKLLYLMLADCYSKMNQPERTAELYERMDARFELNAEEYMMWGMNLKKLAMYPEAASVFERMKGSAPATAERLMKNCELQDLTGRGLAEEISHAPFNTPHADFGPALYRNNLVYCSSRSDLLRPQQVNTGNRNAFQNQLYTLPNTAAKPVFLRSGLKDHYNNGPVCYADEAGIVAFVKNNFTDGQSQINPDDNNLSIYFAKVEQTGDWTETVPFEHNSVNYSNAWPWLSPDGHSLYFASNRPGGMGGYDMYVSQRTSEGKWTEPKNLGRQINTEGNEITPFIHAEELYFASDWHRGLGGMDVFRLRTEGDKSLVENLGAGINSSRDDYGLVLRNDGSNGYFTSNRPGGSGNEDIYGFRLNDSPMALTVSEVNISPTAVSLQGVEMNADQEPLDSPVYVADGARWKEKFSDGEHPSEPDTRKTIYSIQVAAYSEGGGGYQNIAGSLSDIGKVYKVYFANMIKVRVGTFDEESNARQALAKVKQRGYPDAFLVKEEMVVKSGDEIQLPAKAESVEKEPIASGTVADKQSSAEEKTPDYQIAPERLKDMPVYRVRIASYTEESWFDDSKVRQLGDIIKEKKGEWTVFYLGDYRTIEDAEEVRTAVKEAGFNAAQLYMQRNGELIKVQ